MITCEGTTVTRTDPYRHKFADAMAEYLYERQFMEMHDFGGDEQCPTGWWVQFGRRILRGDADGFIRVETWPSVDAADCVVTALELYWAAWDETWGEGSPWVEDSPELPDETELGRRDQYLAYCTQNARENLGCFSFDYWRSLGQPVGYPFG